MKSNIKSLLSDLLFATTLKKSNNRLSKKDSPPHLSSNELSP
jgi:hypothetical protein